MTIAVQACDDPYGQGSTIVVNNVDEVARAVAWCMVQQYAAANRIILGQPPGSPPTGVNVEEIITERLRTKDNAGDESDHVKVHRDGLLFQYIAWLASHTDRAPSDYIQRPHLIPAGKGIDGAIVHFGADAAFATLSICEDKATDDPRTIIHRDVWPEIVACEQGKKDDELRAVLIDALVRRGIDDDAAEKAAAAVLWDARRRYRIRTTVGDTHKTPPTRGHLFKEFDEKAPGDKERRRGDTLYVADLRAWMDDFAERVKAHLRAM